MASEVVINVTANDNFSGVLGNFGSIITGIESGIRLAGDAFRAFAGFAMEGLDAIASYERLAASFETLTAKELLATGVAEDMNEALKLASPLAEDLLKWNQELAINSPFTAEGVANALRMAMAYGFTVDEAKRLTEAMIDFAAGSGASEAAMEAIARALGQISATGKVTGGDMLQLVNAGLPVVEILAEGFNVTTAELMEMRSKGLLPATEAIEYITQYLETNFAGAAERQANTWAGLQGTFEDIKDMGLREFFGGLFEGIQPFMVEWSTFLQGTGMDALSAIGGKIEYFFKTWAPLQTTIDFLEMFNDAVARGWEPLDALGIAFANWGKNSEFVSTLNLDLPKIGDALFKMNDALSDGESLWDAFKIGLDRLAELAAGDPLGDIAARISELIETSETEGWSIALKDLFLDAITSIDWGGIVEAMDDRLAEFIEGHDWGVSGASFGRMIENQFKSWMESDTIDGPSSDAVAALGNAISEWFLAAMNQPNWEQAGRVFGEILRTELLPGILGGFSGEGEGLGAHFEEMGRNVGDAIREGVTSVDLRIREWLVEHFSFDPGDVSFDIGKSIAEGLNSGLDFLLNLDEWVRNNIITPVMRALGIASPSTVFAQIGRDIISGLLSGINAMSSTILSGFRNLLDDILSLPGFQQIADALGIGGGSVGGATGDATGMLGGSTGTAGTGAPGTGPGGTTSMGSGTTINQYFAGANITVGSWDEIAYDCIYPNPFIGATSGQLGSGGGGGGGAMVR